MRTLARFVLESRTSALEVLSPPPHFPQVSDILRATFKTAMTPAIDAYKVVEGHANLFSRVKLRVKKVSIV